MKPFDFENYSWPPKGWNGDTNRFSTSCEFLSKGSFRSVYFAHDNVTDQPLVLKKFTEDHPKEKVFWVEDIKASKEAQKIAIRFNEESMSSKSVGFVEPIVDSFAGYGRRFVNGETMLVEP